MVEFDGKKITVTLTADDLRADKMGCAGFRPFVSDEDWERIQEIIAGPCDGAVLGCDVPRPAPAGAKLLHVWEAAHEMRCSVRTIRNRMKSGDLDHVRNGRVILIPRESVERYFKRQLDR